MKHQPGPLTRRVNFSVIDATLVLLRSQQLHEGLWNLTFEFDATATIFLRHEGRAAPAAVTRILRLALQRTTPEQANDLTVDAAVVNPPRVLIAN